MSIQTTVDSERIDRNRQELREAQLDLVVCAMPINVLLLSGYWPVIGDAICLFTSEGKTQLLVPQDERRFAETSWADNVSTFSTGAPDRMENLIGTIWSPLYECLSNAVHGQARIGIESGPAHVPASYVAMNAYGEALPELIRSILPRASCFIADQHLARLRSTLTKTEIAKVRAACKIAATAFDEGRGQLRTGITEREAANLFHDRLSAPGDGLDMIARAGGHTYCMSGPNSYNAAAAFQYSGNRRLRAGDLVLVHCNSFADGFWTDITRTYVLGEADELQRRLFHAIFSARQAAIDEVRPGAKASDVDRAARSVMERQGFAKEFKHGLGHAVGFHAIDHNAAPRLHPASSDILETGMVFNVEPAVYIEDLGGARHCDIAAVTDIGAELLTPFQCSLDDMFVSNES